MSDVQQIIIDVYHPTFRKGYFEGRRDGFRAKGALVDKPFVDGFQKLFEKSIEEETEETQEDMLYKIGYFLGQMSSCVIPREPRKRNTAERQETFLRTVRTKYGVVEENFIEKIRQLWTLQDHLSRILGEDTFEEMLALGAKLGFL